MAKQYCTIEFDMDCNSWVAIVKPDNIIVYQNNNRSQTLKLIMELNEALESIPHEYG